MFEMIRKAASTTGHEQKGVWASFGHPYACLGELTEPSSKLPSLHRDEMNKPPP